MQCYESGQVFILPVEGGADYLARRWVERQERDRLEILYSIEDILRYYEVDTHVLQKQFGAFPFVARVPEGQEREFAARFRNDAAVQVAIPNFHITPLQTEPCINHQIIDDAIETLSVRALSPECGKDVKIAVIDTGVDPRILPHPRKLYSKQYATDVPSASSTGLKPTDSVGHGSAVAFIINSIAPGATILSIKMMEQTGNVGGLIAAIYLAEADFRPDIFNLSLALSCDVDTCGSCGNPLGAEAGVNEAQLRLLFSIIDKREIVLGDKPLLVAAAGNNSNNIKMPASFPNILAVGSYDMSLSDIAGYSNYVSVTPDRFILAPGGLQDKAKCIAYKSKTNWGREVTLFGTSFSAAFVTGIAARYLCATKASPCSGMLPFMQGTSAPLQGRDYMMTCLTQHARPIPNYPPEKQGLGLARYAF